MSSQNPQLNHQIQMKASAVASTFSLPALPADNTGQHSHQNLLPLAAAALRQMLSFQENFSTDTEPSLFAVLPPLESSSDHHHHHHRIITPTIPQPSRANNNNNNIDRTRGSQRGAAFRSALVREAAKFVEDPDSYRDAYKRSASVVDEQHQSSFRLFAYDRSYEEKMRSLMLTKTPLDGESNLQETRKIQQSLARNNARDHQSFLTSRRTSVEAEEEADRGDVLRSFDETRNLLLARGAAFIEEYFDDARLQMQNDERRQRLAVSGTQRYKEQCQLRLYFVSQKFLLQLAQLWRSGINQTCEVLDFANLEAFALRRTDAARRLQRVGRGLLSRRFSGTLQWNEKVGRVRVARHYLDAQQKFEQYQRSLRERFQLHSLEALEQYCRRVVVEQAFSGLTTLLVNANQVQVILGEYDARRRILLEEDRAVANDLIPNVINPARHDLYLIISSRLKLTLQRRFERCPHVRNAVLVLQKKFFRPCLRKEFGASYSTSAIHDAFVAAATLEPIRPLSKLTKALRKRIVREEGEEEEEKKSPRSSGDDSMFRFFHAPLMCAEELARNRLLSQSLKSLQRLYNLCFDEGSVGIVAGVGMVRTNPSSSLLLLSGGSFSSPPSSAPKQETRRRQNESGDEQNKNSNENYDQEAENNENDEEDEEERFVGMKPKHEQLMRKDRFRETPVEVEFRCCRSVNNRWCLLVTSFIRPSHLNFVTIRASSLPSTSSSSPSSTSTSTSTKSSSSRCFFSYAKLCSQFLTPFKPVSPIELPEIEWYRLRGAVDVAPLIAEAFSRNKHSAAEIYARTIGQLIKRRRATSAEIRRETLQQLQQQALERLAVEVEEWNSRWVGGLEMLQAHAHLLLTLDWQRSWMTLKAYCEEDEVATLQYLATQNFDQYRRDVSEVLRGVHHAAVTIHRGQDERNFWNPSKNKRGRHAIDGQHNKKNQNITCYDETDDEEEDNVDFWRNLLLLEQNKSNVDESGRGVGGDAIASSTAAANVLNMYDDDEDDEDIYQVQCGSNDEDAVEDVADDADDEVRRKRREQERFYQDLYGVSDDENEKL